MLEPVARNKLSFRVAGLFQDGRGVVVGQTAVVVLLSIERVMSLLRLLSEELSLDDLLPSLRIEVVHNPLSASSYLLSFQSSDSLLLDRAARLARLVGAQLCVGAGQHFVAYRDEHAPLGYDVRQPLTEPGDLALYTPTFAQPYRRVREVRLSQLLGQLQLLPLPGGLRAQLCPPEVDGYAERAVTPAGQAETFLTCGRGLLDRLLRYLWQLGVSGELLIPDPLPAPAGPVGEKLQTTPLLRLTAAPVALLLRLASLPSVRLLRLEGNNFLIELGYTHPLRLSSFSSLFPHQDLFVFLGQRRGPLRARSPSRVPLSRLLTPVLVTEDGSPEGGLSTPLLPRLLTTATPTAPPLRLSLRLSHKPRVGSQVPPTATLIPWSRLPTLQRLLGVLSGDALWALRAIGLPVGLLVFGGEAVQHLVSGDLLDEPASLLFVPRCYQLLPQLPPAQLRALLGQSDDQLLVFVPGETQPLALPKSLAVPLSMRLLYVLAAKHPQTPLEPVVVPEPAAALVSEPLSFFSMVPLWGLSGDPEGS